MIHLFLVSLPSWYGKHTKNTPLVVLCAKLGALLPLNPVGKYSDVAWIFIFGDL